MAESSSPSASTRISAGPPAAENTSASTPVISPARTAGGSRIAFTKPPPSVRTPDGAGKTRTPASLRNARAAAVSPSVSRPSLKSTTRFSRSGGSRAAAWRSAASMFVRP